MGTVAIVLVTLAGLVTLVFCLENSSRMSERWAGVCAAVLGVILLALVWADWGVGRLSDERYKFQGRDLPILGWIAIALALVVVVTGLLASVGKLNLSTLTTVPAVVIFVVTVLFVILAETVSRLIPSFIIPKTVRRLTLDVGAGHGAWLALIVASSCVLCLSGRLSEWTEHSVMWVSDLLSRPVRLLMYISLIISLGLLTASRYMSWIEIDALNGVGGVAGWAAPFIGPSTLMALLAAYLGLGVFFLRHRLGGLIILGVACSYLAIAATVSYTTTLIFDNSAIANLVTRFMGMIDDGSTINRGWGPVVMFLASLAVVTSLSLISADESYE